MLTKLKDRIKASARLRDERGATDPILVIAAIAVSLVLLVGGSFAVAGIITNGKNLNAKSDLSKVSVAEVAAFAQADSYLAYTHLKSGAESGDTDPNGNLLSKSGVGFTPTVGGALAVILVPAVAADPTTTPPTPASPAGWVAISGSTSGAIYVSSSTTAQIVDVSQASTIGITSTQVTNLKTAAGL